METLLCFRHIRPLPAGVPFPVEVEGNYSPPFSMAWIRLHALIYCSLQSILSPHPSIHPLTPRDQLVPSIALMFMSLDFSGQFCDPRYVVMEEIPFSFTLTIAEYHKHAHPVSCCSRVNSECNWNKGGTESTPQCVEKQTEQVSVEPQQRRRQCGKTRTLPVSASIRCVSYFQASPFLLRCDCLTWITMALGRT